MKSNVSIQPFCYGHQDLNSEQPYLGYQQQEQDREALEAYENEPLICYFCKLAISQGQSMNLHHTVYKSKGGTEVEPAHERCHVEYHSRQGDFREWGRQSAQTRRWAVNLKNVKDNPAYDFDRQYYFMLYGN